MSFGFREWESVELAKRRSPEIFSTSTNSIRNLSSTKNANFVYFLSKTELGKDSLKVIVIRCSRKKVRPMALSIWLLFLVRPNSR